MPANINNKNGKPDVKASANPAPKKAAKPALERKNGRLVPPVKPDPKKIKEKKQAKAKKLAAENERKLKAEQAKIEKKTAVSKGKGAAHKNARSRALRNGFLGTVAVIAGLLVLAFVIHHLYDYIAEKPVFSFVTTGSVEHTIGARALIVRDETIIASTTGGELVTSITEGSRVAKAQELGIVVPADMESVVSNLRNVQQQISDVQQEIIAEGGISEAETIYTNYNKNLSSIIDSIRYDSMTGNLGSLASYSASVNVILDEREDELSNIDFDRVSSRQVRARSMRIFPASLRSDLMVSRKNSHTILSCR